MWFIRIYEFKKLTSFKLGGLTAHLPLLNDAVSFFPAEIPWCFTWENGRHRNFNMYNSLWMYFLTFIVVLYLLGDFWVIGVVLRLLGPLICYLHSDFISSSMSYRTTSRMVFESSIRGWCCNYVRIQSDTIEFFNRLVLVSHNRKFICLLLSHIIITTPTIYLLAVDTIEVATTNPAELSNRHSQRQLGQKIHLFFPESIFSDHLRDQPIQEDELLRAICCILWPIEIKETSSIRIQFVCETDYVVSQFLTDEEWVQEVGCVELGY